MLVTGFLLVSLIVVFPVVTAGGGRARTKAIQSVRELSPGIILTKLDNEVAGRKAVEWIQNNPIKRDEQKNLTNDAVTNPDVSSEPNELLISLTFPIIQGYLGVFTITGRMNKIKNKLLPFLDGITGAGVDFENQNEKKPAYILLADWIRNVHYCNRLIIVLKYATLEKLNQALTRGAENDLKEVGHVPAEKNERIQVNSKMSTSHSRLADSVNTSPPLRLEGNTSSEGSKHSRSPPSEVRNFVANPIGGGKLSSRNLSIAPKHTSLPKEISAKNVNPSLTGAIRDVTEKLHFISKMSQNIKKVDVINTASEYFRYRTTNSQNTFFQSIIALLTVIITVRVDIDDLKQSEKYRLLHIQSGKTIFGLHIPKTLAKYQGELMFKYNDETGKWIEEQPVEEEEFDTAVRHGLFIFVETLFIMGCDKRIRNPFANCLQSIEKMPNPPNYAAVAQAFRKENMEGHFVQLTIQFS